MNDSTPPGQPPPKMSRAEAENMIKLMEQELVLQRAKRVAQGEGGHDSKRWLALAGVLFLLLLVFLIGVWQTSVAVKDAPKKANPPTVAPKK